MAPGNANLLIGVLLIGVLQTANREIGVPGKPLFSVDYYNAI